MKKSTAFFLAANSLLLGFALGVIFAPEVERIAEEGNPKASDIKAELKPLQDLKIEELKDSEELEEL